MAKSLALLVVLSIPGASLEDFRASPVNGTWNSPAAPLRLISRSERMFRVRLSNAAEQAPDFAGHYRFAFWGCGPKLRAVAFPERE